MDVISPAHEVSLIVAQVIYLNSCQSKLLHILQPIWALSTQTFERQSCEESLNQNKTPFQPLVDLEAALPNVTATISGLAGVKVANSMNIEQLNCHHGQSLHQPLLLSFPTLFPETYLCSHCQPHLMIIDIAGAAKRSPTSRCSHRASSVRGSQRSSPQWTGSLSSWFIIDNILKIHIHFHEHKYHVEWIKSWQLMLLGK